MTERRAATILLWLLLAATAARYFYLFFFCSYALVQDEAHYWEWARRPALSYYSKGPGIAWLIALGTQIAGNTEAGVRLFAPFASAAVALGAALTTRLALRSWKPALYAAAIVLLIPAYQFLAIAITIDGPYIACWSIALAGLALATIRGNTRGWLLFGAAIGVGFLFKYTILLLIPGALLALLALRDRYPKPERKAAHLRAALAGAAITLVCLLPVFIWNAQHDWATVRHLLGHLGVAGGDTAHHASRKPWNPTWTLEYIGAQIAIVGPALLPCFYGLWHARRSGRPVARATTALALTAAPVLLFYLAVSFFTRVEGNWPLAGYLGLLPAAGWGAMTGIELGREAFHRRWAWRITLAFGIVTALLMFRLDLFAKAPLIGDFVPIGRLTSGRLVAESAAEHLATLDNGFVLTHHYGRASQLAFYLEGHPTTYCASAHTGGRQTQYDHWPETDLTNPDTEAALLGRDAVVLGGDAAQWRRFFATVEELGPLEGDHKSYPAFLARSYQGLPNTAPDP